MSDEQAPPPPALRLKPRLRPPGEQAPAGVPNSNDLPAFTPTPPLKPDEADAIAQSAPAPVPPKIRFKPRIPSPDSDGTAASAASGTPAEFVPAPDIPSITPPSAVANPHVVAPSPGPFVSPPLPASAPLVGGETPAPASPAVEASSPAAVPLPANPVEGGKFKLKPKAPSSEAPPASAGSLPPADAAPSPGAPDFVFAPPPPVAVPPPPPVPAAKPPILAGAKAPPPFPVAAPKKGPPPVPPLGAPATSGAPPVARPPARGSQGANPRLVRLAALLVVGAGIFFAWKYFAPAASTPPAEPVPPPAAATPKKAPGGETPAAPLTPSDSLNQLAHVPANAINKAKEIIDARANSGQTRIDATTIGEDLPTEPNPSPPVAPAKQAALPPAPAPSPVASTIAPGVAATSEQVKAVAEASAPFRTFVANAKVSGVFQGPPTRAMINGRLTRAGEIVDASLGITFTGVDSPRRLLIFVDRSGAMVTRRF